MLPMPKYKNHMRVDQACSRERHDINRPFRKSVNQFCDCAHV